MFRPPCAYWRITVVYREIDSYHDVTLQPPDLTYIYESMCTWPMYLSISKSKTMRMSCRNPTCPTYGFDCRLLQHVLPYKYLGVHITSDLSRKLHFENVINSVKPLAFLKTNFRFVPSSLKLRLYKPQVRSKLEYTQPLSGTSA